MTFLNKILSWASFSCLAIAILISPWLFGAWEMWWFWPFAIFIFLSTLFFAIRLFLPAGLYPCEGKNLTILLISACLIFLVYAFIRFQATEVFMTAERSFLLFLTPFLIGIQILLGFNKKTAKLLLRLIIFNLLLLGLYGIINHFITGSEKVLWANGFEQYYKEGRASGSYYCPDHFAGIMELALCLMIPFLLNRKTKWQWKIFVGLLSATALLGIVLSKSRGGGLTVIVIGIAALIWGFSQWKPSVRWCWRLSSAAIAVLILVLFCNAKSPYINRFKSYLGHSQEQKIDIKKKLLATSRGKMISGALRAWKDHPIIGIGPGMHQNLWPHYAASPDGNRDDAIWPTQPNYTFHSYRVHSDWVQLLEEYGLIGLILFLLPAGTVFSILLIGYNKNLRLLKEKNYSKKYCDEGNVLILSGILSFVCMAFHSLGDFNLQMPATTWMLAAIISIALVHILQPTENE